MKVRGVAIAVALAALVCTAGEIAVPFDAIRDIPRLKAFRGRDCTFCNVGSNSGFYGFDWESAGVNGANFATGPQSLAQGFALLEHFADRLAKDCTVFIPICPFSSISVPERFGPERQYKIYPFKDGKDIYLWTPERAAAVDKAVTEAEANWTGTDERLAAPDRPVAPEEFRKSVEFLLKCWRGEFDITDFAAPLSERNRKGFAANVEIMRKGLETCRAKGWRTIVVLPPVSRYYDAVFSDKVWRQYVDDFIAAAHVEGVPYWDYSRDERFRDDANFRDSLMMNRRGSALFTKELVRRAEAESPCAAFRRELRAFYPDECHGICKDPRQTNSVAAIGRELDAWAAAHPGFDALDIRREEYLAVRRHVQPFLFKTSPFYFELGCNGGWCHNSTSVPGRHVNRICARFYKEQNLIPDEAFRLQGARSSQALALCCGPFVDDMHHVPPFRKILATGFKGVRDEVAAALAKCPEDDPLGRKELETALVGLDTVHAIQLKFHEAALAALAESNNPSIEHSNNLRRIAEASNRCPWEPPRTFFEGLNTLWFIREVLGYVDGTDQFSLGRPDAWLIGLYRADLAAGRITAEESLELVGKFLMTADCHHDRTIAVDGYNDHEMEIPMSLGGCDKGGTWVWNELTEMFLDAHLGCDCVFPKLHCRISASAPKAYLEKLGALLMAEHAVFTLLNDDRYLKQYTDEGFAPEDAREYVGVGCWNGFIDSVMDVDEANYLSIMGIVERTVHRDPELEKKLRLRIESIDDAKSINEVREILYGNAIRFCRDIMGEYSRWGRANAKVFPHPVYSMCLRGCVESRRDTTDGGVPPQARPKIITLGFIGNVVDSIAAINQICFVDRVCTVREYLDAVRSNWTGERGAELRRRALNAPYWGDGTRFTTDELAWWMRSLRRDTDGCRNDQDGEYKLAIYTYREFMYWGARMKATPDGRRDGDRLAQGFSPSEVKCKSGITTLMNAIGELPHENLYASNVNLTFDRSAMNAELLAAVLRVFCEKGSHMIQPNCNSVEELLDAQEHPERHQNLIVRVCGFSAKFIYLSKRWQDEVIARHRLK